ncbi:MAG: hypothetical protein ACO1SV_12690 [Fimbriimonas sp.]
MVRQLKFFALALACSTAAYAVGFAWQVEKPIPVKPIAAGARVGNVSTASNFHDTLTPIQQALSMHISHKGNVLMEDVADPKVRDRIIVAMNYLMMITLSPAQQDANLAWIQIDTYRPGPGPWDRVRKAPTLVDAILRVTPSQQKQFAKWEAEAVERQRHKWAHLAGMPKEEAIQRQREEMARKSRAQHQAEWSAMLAREQSQIVSILTREQRDEWNEIMAKTDLEYRQALGR